MKFLVINGPNLNLLGLREPEVYGADTYGDLEELVRDTCHDSGIAVTLFQSNHEGAIVDAIQAARGVYDGFVINPAAYTHTSIALLDALLAVGIPAVEVHISDLSTREAFRQVSYAGRACIRCFSGAGIDGYRQAILFLQAHLEGPPCV
ncbi:MAG: 3-dehydroquinate dehydratase [Oscillospiraceae bacterium]|nr:3-dehydroquinate dehydratase [Oscillospiraceae bacterium]